MTQTGTYVVTNGIDYVCSNADGGLYLSQTETDRYTKEDAQKILSYLPSKFEMLEVITK